MKCLEFREDLKRGMSIEDALVKHGLSFQTAFNVLQYKQPDQPGTVIKPRFRKPKNHPKKKHSQNYVKSNEMYIMQRNNTFCIRKQIKGTTRMFGTYNSLEDALKMREALEQDGWHQRHVDKICKELGILRRKGHPNSKVRYS